MNFADQSPSAHEDEIGRLLSALCDGVLTADERDHLEELIHSSPEAKLFSAVFLDLHARMLWRYRERSGSQSAAELRETELRDIEDAARTSAGAKAQPTPLRFLGQSLPWPLWEQVSPRMLGMTVVIGLASYFAGMLVMIGIQRAQVGQSHADRPVAQQNANETAGQPSGPKLAAQNTRPSKHQHGTLTASSDAKGLEGQVGSGAAIKIGYRYHLAAGWAEVVLPLGTRIVFQGPADWRFESEQRLALESGCLVARVPRAAVGFTVAAGVAEIVDLGTEFGVTVVDSTHTDVEVQHGSVLVRPQSSNTAAPPPSPPPSITLVAGESRRLSAGPGGKMSAQSFAGGSSSNYRRLSGLPAARRAAAGGIRIGPDGEELPSRVTKILEEDSVDHTSEQAYAVSSDDLINQGSPALLSIETSLPELSNGSNAEALSDGSLGITSAADAKPSLRTGAWVDDKPWSVTFNLQGAYDIDQINTYAAWIVGRISQTYRVFVSTDPARKEFSEFPLADVNYAADTGTSQVQLSAEGGGPIALGVTAIRFEIAIPNGVRGLSTVYREIDVFGSPVAGSRQSPAPDKLKNKQ